MKNVNADDLEKDAMYKFDGVKLVKLDINQDVIKVPITREADVALKELRKKVAAVMATRPDLSIVASAVLIHAVNLDGITDVVKAYGVKLYQGDME
jgi:hypothetical protein